MLLAYMYQSNTSQMPNIGHMYQEAHVYISDNYVSIYTLYELTAVNTVMTNTGYIHFTLLAYALEPICLPHQTCLSHCTSKRLHIDPNLLHIQVKQNNKLQLYLSRYKHMCASNKYASQMPHMPITSCAGIRQLWQYIYLICSHCNDQCDHDH